MNCYTISWSKYLIFLSLCLALKALPSDGKLNRLKKLNGLQFLISVNTTYTPPHGCLATVKTPFIEPDTPWNKSENIMVGGCDNGPLTYGVGYDDNHSGAMGMDSIHVKKKKDQEQAEDLQSPLNEIKKILTTISLALTIEHYFEHRRTPNKLETIYLTFYSHAVLDASHPACQITFDGNYLVPEPGKFDMSLLPNCFVMDSREGENMTYFWFKIFDWRFGK